MKSDTETNLQPIQRIYYTRKRQFSRFMSHLIAGMFILWGVWILYHIYEDPSFAPMLIVYIPTAIYVVAYFHALTDTCVITSEKGIEYKRPEFSIQATWSQIKSLKRNSVLPMFGLHYYVLLDAPTILYTKGFGTAYKVQLNHIFFPSWQNRIPFGKMWQAYEELESEIRTHAPSFPFESS